MSDEVNRLWEQGAEQAFRGKREIEAELASLEGKDDPASKDRYMELIDELMTLDMGLGPFRRAMGQAPKAKPEEKEGEADQTQDPGDPPAPSNP